MGEGRLVKTHEQLRQAMAYAFSRERTTKKRGRPLVINVVIDPYSSRKPQVGGKFLTNFEFSPPFFTSGSFVAD